MKKLIFLLSFATSSICYGAFTTDKLTVTSTFTVTGSTIILNGTTYFWQAGTGSSGQFLQTDGAARPTLTFGTASGSGGSGSVGSTAYGSLYTKNGAANQTGISASTVTLTFFSNAGISTHAVSNATTDSVTVATTGIFNVYAVFVSSDNAGSSNLYYSICVNGVPSNFSGSFNPINYYIPSTISGILSLNVGDAVTLCGFANESPGIGLSIVDAQLVVSAVGGIGGTTINGGDGVSVYPATSTVILPYGVLASTGVFSSSITATNLTITNNFQGGDIKLIQAGNQGIPGDAYGDLFEVIASTMNPFVNTTRIRGRNNMLFYVNTTNVKTSTATLAIDDALVTVAGLAVNDLTASQFVKTDANKRLSSQAQISLASDVTGTLSASNFVSTAAYTVSTQTFTGLNTFNNNVTILSTNIDSDDKYSITDSAIFEVAKDYNDEISTYIADFKYLLGSPTKTEYSALKIRDDAVTSNVPLTVNSFGTFTGGVINNSISYLYDDVRLYESGGTPTEFVTLKSSASLTSNQLYILPNSYGSIDQVLAIGEQRGTGVRTLYWKTDASGSGGSSSLGVFQNGAQVSSPTVQINFIGPPFSVSLGGSSTATVTLNGSSVTLQGNTFNAANKLLQLSGSGLITNSLVDGSSITKQGLLLAGSNITLTPSAGALTIAATSGGGASVYPATSTAVFPYGFSSSTGVFTSSVTAYSIAVQTGSASNPSIMFPDTSGQRYGFYKDVPLKAIKMVSDGIGIADFYYTSIGLNYPTTITDTSGVPLYLQSNTNGTYSRYANTGKTKYGFIGLTTPDGEEAGLSFGSSVTGVTLSSQAVKINVEPTSTKFGNVGINISTPTAKLHVGGTMIVESTFTVTQSTMVLNGTTYYWNAGAGSNGQFLKTDGAVKPTLTWGTASGSSGFNYIFNAAQANLPGANAPYISNSTNAASAGVFFDEISTQTVTWSSMLNNYSGGTLYSDIIYTSSATSGTMNWGVYIECKTPSVDALDYDTDSFSTVNSTSVTVGATSGMAMKATATLTNEDSCANGDTVRIKLERRAGETDTAIGKGRVRFLRLYE